jgi:hypothetical protein
MKTIYYGVRAGDINKGLGLSLRCFEPEPVKYTNFLPNIKDLNIDRYDKCPAHTQFKKNLFSIKSPIDYELHFDDVQQRFYTNLYDQNFYDSIVFVRSIESRLISFNIAYHFFTEEKELYISQEQASFHTNKFIDNTILIPGKFDVAKFPRNLELAFHVKRKIEVSIGDDLYYVRFHTNENLQFKKFFVSDKYLELCLNLMNLKNGKKSIKNLNYYYDLYTKHPKYKKLMLDEIKNNLMD